MALTSVGSAGTTRSQSPVRDKTFKGAVSDKAFNRCYYLSITDPYKDTNFNFRRGLSQGVTLNRTSISTKLVMTQSVEKMGLAIDFTITKKIPKQDQKSKNAMTLKIYNLARYNIDRMNVGDVMQLDCGYNNDIANVFTGTITRISSATKGPDKCTTIIATEMPRPNPKQMVKMGSITMPRGTNERQFCERLCQTLVDVIPSLVDYDMSEVPAIYTSLKPRVLFGIDFVDTLLRVLSKYRMRYVIRSGVIIAVPHGGNKTFVMTDINPSNGLINVAMGQDKKEKVGKGKDAKEIFIPGYKVTSLLNNKLQIGDWIRVRDTYDLDPKPTISEILHIEKMTIKGNSFAGVWQTSMDAYIRPLPKDNDDVKDIVWVNDREF